MEATPHLSHGILLVSNDSFVMGFVNGYCHANLISFKCISPESFPCSDSSTESYGLVVLDDRSTPATATDKSNSELLQRVKSIASKTSTALCVIFDDLENISQWQRSGVKFLLEEPIIDRLDSCFRQHFDEIAAKIIERRRGDRRRNNDRRRRHSASLPGKMAPTPHASREMPKRNIDQAQQLEPFAIDMVCKSVYLDGQNLALTCKEYRLFQLLSSDTSRVFHAEELVAHLWPYNDRASKSDLYQYMHLLRKKVEVDPYNPRWIVTVKGVGYQLQLGKEQPERLASG